MSFWSRLTGGNSRPQKSQKLDYLREALALERQGDYDAALTSYRLALRDQPSNSRVLQNMAIAYTKMGQIDQAIKCYRGALQVDPKLSGAHYGLAFLLLKRGDVQDAEYHLDAFLMDPPNSQDSERWITHAQDTLKSLRADPNDGNPMYDEQDQGTHSAQGTQNDAYGTLDGMDQNSGGSYYNQPRSETD